MKIIVENRNWIELNKEEDKYTLSFDDSNGNEVEVIGIHKRYIKHLIKDIEKEKLK